MVPGTTFDVNARKTPVAITYPPTDRLAWERGDMRSQYASTSIDKHVSKDAAAAKMKSSNISDQEISWFLWGFCYTVSKDGL